MNRAQNYYDAFSESYERERHHGYHRLLDDLELGIAERFCRGHVLEAGCGTGLILERLARSAERATGVDLSAGMISHARKRRLEVSQATVDKLPFPDETFDAVFSFKVLAHVPAIEQALAELVRVTRPGGHLVLEFYNRWSLRHLLKRLKPPTPIADAYTDVDVYTRYDTLPEIRQLLPPTVAVRELRGIRLFTPVARLHSLPLVGPLLGSVERAATAQPWLSRLGGFLVVILQKERA